MKTAEGIEVSVEVSEKTIIGSPRVEISRKSIALDSTVLYIPSWSMSTSILLIIPSPSVSSGQLLTFLGLDSNRKFLVPQLIIPIAL